METLKETIKQERQTIIHQSLNTSYDTNKIFTFLDSMFSLIFKQYDECMNTLSQEITGRKIDRQVLFFENNTVVKKHLLYLFTGALYGRIFKEKKHCYAKIYNVMYPIDISHLTFNPLFLKIIEKQADITLHACHFYKRFGIRIGGPMMCSYCVPELSVKDSLRFTLQRLFYRLQGIK